MGQQQPNVQLPPQSKEEKDRLLSEIPGNARRVKVIDVHGKHRWREPNAIEAEDRIQVKKNGKAIIQTKKVGRRSLVVSEEDRKARDLRQAIENDPLFQITKQAPDSPQVLNQVMVSLAQEAASMQQERIRREGDGLSTTQVSGKRVTTLKAIGDTWLKWREQTTSDEIDLDSEKFKVLFKFIMETFHQSLSDSNLRPEQIETVMARLVNLMEGDWAVDARRRMKKVG